MRKTIFRLIVLSLLISCNTKRSINQPAAADTSKSFFPVTDYLLGQIQELNNTPVTPLKITTYKGKTDSVWMKPGETNAFVKNFTMPVIDSLRLHGLFKEKSFLDQTINAFTLTYDPVKALADTVILKRWDVYIDAGTHNVNRIYIEKKLPDKEADYSQKLTWKTGQYCKIITMNDNDTSLQNVKEEQLIWNFNE